MPLAALLMIAALIRSPAPLALAERKAHPERWQTEPIPPISMGGAGYYSRAPRLTEADLADLKEFARKWKAANPEKPGEDFNLYFDRYMKACDRWWDERRQQPGR